MNLIILGIMALCGASLNKIAIVAIILGVFDVLRDVFENISAQLKEYMDIYKQNQEKEDE
jgi:cell shape-determining protein MreC